MIRDVTRRRLLVATPLALVALGGLALAASPWPAILKLMLHGSQVMVAPHWSTVGLPIVTAITWGGAIWLSLLIRPQR